MKHLFAGLALFATCALHADYTVPEIQQRLQAARVDLKSHPDHSSSAREFKVTLALVLDGEVPGFQPQPSREGSIKEALGYLDRCLGYEKDPAVISVIHEYRGDLYPISETKPAR